MTTTFLTDSAFWITICATHLQVVGARASYADAEQTATDLYDDPEYQGLQPTAAADAFRARQREAA